MGILSGLVIVRLKYGSKYPMTKKSVITKKIQSPPLLDQSLYIPHFLFLLSNQSLGGKTNGNATVSKVKEIVGADIKSIILFIK